VHALPRKNEQLGPGICKPGFTKGHHAAQHASTGQKRKQAKNAAENANKPASVEIAAKVLNPIG
jgi:hypothetical protein